VADWDWFGRTARIRLQYKLHPENFGEWRSEAEMEEQKLALAGRIGLK
jgi:hypothetical protein